MYNYILCVYGEKQINIRSLQKDVIEAHCSTFNHTVNTRSAQFDVIKTERENQYKRIQYNIDIDAKVNWIAFQDKVVQMHTQSNVHEKESIQRDKEKEIKEECGISVQSSLFCALCYFFLSVSFVLSPSLFLSLHVPLILSVVYRHGNIEQIFHLNEFLI